MLQRSALLNAAAIGLLASLGKQTVRVYRKPVIDCLVTGSELRKAEQSCGRGDLLSPTLRPSSLPWSRCGYSVKQLAFARDRMAEGERQAKRPMKVCDVVLFSGGISVGISIVLPVPERLGSNNYSTKSPKTRKAALCWKFGEEDRVCTTRQSSIRLGLPVRICPANVGWDANEAASGSCAGRVAVGFGIIPEGGP